MKTYRSVIEKPTLFGASRFDSVSLCLRRGVGEVQTKKCKYVGSVGEVGRSRPALRRQRTGFMARCLRR